jgi:hypothetical protein
MYAQFGLEQSSNVKARNLKFLFWGKTSTRKTEGVLRNFPKVLLIDAEGNSDQCVDMPEIPEFVRIKTKDQRKVLQILDAVIKGKLLFLDSTPFDTVCIDSASVIWSVQQEVAYKAAEQRAARFNKDISQATATQRDWSLAKRPLKELANLMNASPVRFFVLIGREKDLYKETQGENDKLVRIGVQADVMKGTDYEVNCALHFQFDENGKWFAEVTKVQGALAAIFPMGKRISAFPMAEVAKYATRLTGLGSTEKSENTVADEIAEQELDAEAPHTQKELIEYAKTKGIEAKDLGALLKAAGFNGFDPKHWLDMKTLIDQVLPA